MASFITLQSCLDDICYDLYSTVMTCVNAVYHCYYTAVNVECAYHE